MLAKIHHHRRRVEAGALSQQLESCSSPDSLSNFTNAYALATAGAAGGQANFADVMENVADMENWMRVSAANHAAGNWDMFGSTGSGQNVDAWISPEHGWTLFTIDLGICLGNSIANSPGSGMTSFYDPVWQQLLRAAAIQAHVLSRAQGTGERPDARVKNQSHHGREIRCVPGRGLERVESGQHRIVDCQRAIQHRVAGGRGGRGGVYHRRPIILTRRTTLSRFPALRHFK